MSVVENIKGEACLVGAEHVYSTLKVSADSIADALCDQCPFCNSIEEGEKCPASEGVGSGEFKYDNDSESFVCVEAVTFNFFGVN